MNQLCDNEQPPSAAWREGTFTLMFEKGLKAYAELAEKPRERDGKKNTHFCPVFFFLRRTFKEPCNLHILSS